jgi:hypothetical protein
MSQGAQRERWSRMSVLLALVHNVNTVHADDRVPASYFDPFAPVVKPAKQSVAILKGFAKDRKHGASVQRADKKDVLRSRGGHGQSAAGEAEGAIEDRSVHPAARPIADEKAKEGERAG